jgi:GT2 family glycosyltransferase
MPKLRNPGSETAEQLCLSSSRISPSSPPPQDLRWVRDSNRLQPRIPAFGEFPAKAQRTVTLMPGVRPTTKGRFFYLGDEKLVLRGVTYGTFRPHEEGHQFPDRTIVASDLAEMSRWGFNAVRTYTPPPPWLLDLAAENNLYVLAGLSWTQHMAFLDDKRLVRQIRRDVGEGARVCAGHPALLGFAVGNEIPPPLVRWHGPHRVARFIRGLYGTVKGIDPEALVTYVNFPTTEYLELRFLDFQSFNVYLEERASLEGYLARLHNIADERPLIMAEIGLDSRRNGEIIQAEVLGWQVKNALRSGCAGAFVYKWTDEWYRGGFDIEDWDFGLTTRDRVPKPALPVVSERFELGPFSEIDRLPRISVVVCTYNGSKTIWRALEMLTALEYPDYEVIVVSDGSTDRTDELVRQFDVRLIKTENRGLSSARNTGAEAATGEIVAYTDDDAYPDPHWLHFLAIGFESGDWAAMGGPNILPPGVGPVEECVSHSPGGATHVLLSDVEAEHLPGCNLSVRRDRLLEVGGFDPQFITAGDDVDLCWRLQERGWKLGYHPGAAVWHHSRDSVRRYWKQQRGYGKAEAQLERKWPEKYNSAGHVDWAGRLYGPSFFQNFGWGRPRIYFGYWGSAPFQAIYHPAMGEALSISMMPEWHLLVAQLGLLSVFGLLWKPLLLAIPLMCLAIGLPVYQAIRMTLKAERTGPPKGFWNSARFLGVTSLLQVTQPLCRLFGRFSQGLTPWRRLGLSGWVWPWPSVISVWSETWRDPSDWVALLQEHLGKLGARVFVSTPVDRWDLEARAGLLGGARVLVTVEEHGAGKQFVRFRVWPMLRFRTLTLGSIVFAVLSTLAFLDGATVAGIGLGLLVAAVLALFLVKSGAALATLQRTIRGLEPDWGE